MVGTIVDPVLEYSLVRPILWHMKASILQVEFKEHFCKLVPKAVYVGIGECLVEGGNRCFPSFLDFSKSEKLRKTICYMMNSSFLH